GEQGGGGGNGRTGPVRLVVRGEPARSQRGRTLTLPVGRRNRRPSASSRVPGGIAIADITRRQAAELLQKSFQDSHNVVRPHAGGRSSRRAPLLPPTTDSATGDRKSCTPSKPAPCCACLSLCSRWLQGRLPP